MVVKNGKRLGLKINVDLSEWAMDDWTYDIYNSSKISSELDVCDGSINIKISCADDFTETVAKKIAKEAIDEFLYNSSIEYCLDKSQKYLTARLELDHDESPFVVDEGLPFLCILGVPMTDDEVATPEDAEMSPEELKDRLKAAGNFLVKELEKIRAALRES